MKTYRIQPIIVLAVAAALVAGCSSNDLRQKVKYENTKTLPPLELPPDLASLPGRDRHPTDSAQRGTATYSEFTKQEKTTAARLSQPGGVVTPDFKDVRVERAGNERWLVVKVPPEAAWPKVREFLLQTGLLIEKEDPAAGLMRTAWSDNRAKIGNLTQTWFGKWFGSLYSTGERDMFRVRIARGTEPGTSEIYIVHYGMEEVIASNDPTGSIQTRWQRRPADPELEAEMLALLMVHFGVALEDARRKTAAGESDARAALEAAGNGGMMLRVRESPDQTWHRLSVSLDRIGFMVERGDREKGIYYVRYDDIWADQESKNIFQKIFGGKDEAAGKRYQVHLSGRGERTDVQIFSADGVPETSATGERILSALYEQLK